MPSRIRKTVRSSAMGPSWTLIVIDHRRLQGAAWAEFHTARKRLEKVTRDLHFHENNDAPAYEAWLHRTFPVLLTTLRAVEAELELKQAMVHEVQARAIFFGGSHRRLWHDLKTRKSSPPSAKEEDEFEGRENGTPGGPAPGSDDFDDWPGGGARSFGSVREPERGPEIRDIYRRLVQRLHPDRGGEWTPARERLWHEVQAAWGAADADWLARLEVEWETVNEVLSASSSVSRLREAIVELHAARRDAERKLRDYRRAPSWRFTKSEKKREQLLQRVGHLLRDDLVYLRRQLDHIKDTISGWEEDWTRSHTKPRRRR